MGAARKHIATYALFGGATGHRVGTGYIYDLDGYRKAEARMKEFGHPFRVRWRNDECWADFVEQVNREETDKRGLIRA